MTVENSQGRIVWQGSSDGEHYRWCWTGSHDLILDKIDGKLRRKECHEGHLRAGMHRAEEQNPEPVGHTLHWLGNCIVWYQDWMGLAHEGAQAHRDALAELQMHPAPLWRRMLQSRLHRFQCFYVHDYLVDDVYARVGSWRYCLCCMTWLMNMKWRRGTSVWSSPSSPSRRR